MLYLEATQPISATTTLNGAQSGIMSSRWQPSAFEKGMPSGLIFNYAKGLMNNSY